MPRKRNQSARSRYAHPTNPAFVYDYFSPGTYFTPRAAPCPCSYLHQYTPQWSTCANYSTATYVVDAGGMVYYLSDLDCVLGIPGPVTMATEMSYYYDDDRNAEQMHVPDEENYVTTPRKRARFNEVDQDADSQEDDSVTDSDIPMQTADQNKVINSKNSHCNTGRVYRSEEGYLVEEPNDPETAPTN